MVTETSPVLDIHHQEKVPGIDKEFINSFILYLFVPGTDAFTWHRCLIYLYLAPMPRGHFSQRSLSVVNYQSLYAIIRLEKTNFRSRRKRKIIWRSRKESRCRKEEPGVKGDYVKEGQKLPMYGKGPYYVFGVLGCTIVCLLWHRNRKSDTGEVQGVLRVIFKIFGAFCTVVGAVLWILSTNKSKMREHIADNELNESGVYGWVRNPMYSGMMHFCSGLLISCGNLFLLIPPCLFYLVLTVMLKNTEEKWLSEVYGEKYSAYCKRVKRCIPWFPKKR